MRDFAGIGKSLRRSTATLGILLMVVSGCIRETPTPSSSEFAFTIVTSKPDNEGAGDSLALRIAQEACGGPEGSVSLERKLGSVLVYVADCDGEIVRGRVLYRPSQDDETEDARSTPTQAPYPKFGGPGATALRFRGRVSYAMRVEKRYLWVYIDRRHGGLIGKIDPRTNALSGEPIDLRKLNAPSVSRFAVGHRAVWVLRLVGGQERRDVRPGELLRIDPSSSELQARIDVGREPTDVILAFGKVWVANQADDTIMRIDPATNDVEREIRVRSRLGPFTLIAAFGSLWAWSRSEELVRLDPRTGRVLESLRDIASAPVRGDDVLWVTVGGTVRQLDPSSTTFTGDPFVVTIGPPLVAADEHAIWIGRWYELPGFEIDGPEGVTPAFYKYRRYDPGRNRLIGPPVVALDRTEGVVGFGSLWVPHPSRPVLLRAG